MKIDIPDSIMKKAKAGYIKQAQAHKIDMQIQEINRQIAELEAKKMELAKSTNWSIECYSAVTFYEIEQYIAGEIEAGRI